MVILSIDFGTSAVKLSLLSEDSRTLQWAKEEYPFMILPGEKNEMKPEDLWGALGRAAAKLDAELRDQVGLVCYDTFSPSPVFLDENGDPVYPNLITHLDRRSRAESADIDRLIGNDKYLSISGIYPFAGGCSAMTFYWFRKNEPWVYEKTARIGHLPTYIHKKLTGEWMVDLVNASMMGVYETTTQGDWSDTVLDALGLEHKWFGKIYAPGTPHGQLLPEPAKLLGLHEGITVCAGTNDVAAAQMGAGNETAGRIMNTTGSSEMVSILTDRPVTNPHYYLRNAAIPGLWQIYSTTAGGFAVDWFYKQFCRDMDKKTYFDEFVPHCIRTWLADNPVTFTPYLSGDRQSLEKKTASWNGLTLGSTREQMFAAVLSAMQGVLRTTIEEAKEVLPLDPLIRISGGMATPTYLELKKHEIPGFDYLIVDDCPILGNLALAKRAGAL